jgi:hypothetical protein
MSFNSELRVCRGGWDLTQPHTLPLVAEARRTGSGGQGQELGSPGALDWGRGPLHWYRWVMMGVSDQGDGKVREESSQIFFFSRTGV